VLWDGEQAEVSSAAAPQPHTTNDDATGQMLSRHASITPCHVTRQQTSAMNVNAAATFSVDDLHQSAAAAAESGLPAC